MNKWLIEVMNKYRDDIHHLKWGASLVVDCPICNHKMLISRSDYNGHIHMSCDNCDQFMVQ